MPRAYNSFFSALQTKPIPQQHPRLLGSRDDLKKMAKDRPESFARMAAIARHRELKREHKDDVDFAMNIGVYSKIMSLALTAAVEEDATLARQAIDLVFATFIGKPIVIGHVPF